MNCSKTKEGHITVHLLGKKDNKISIPLQSIVKDSHTVVAANIESVKIMTDIGFPEHTQKVEFNTNHPVEAVIDGEIIRNFKEALDKFYSKTTSSDL